jgi:hypothetical protein
VVDDNSIIGLRQKPSQLSRFWRRYCEKGLLILPRNVELQTGTINIDAFPSTTKELLAIFNDRGLEAELYGQGNIRRELIRKSADILLPVLFFAGSAAVSVGLNIVAS